MIHVRAINRVVAALLAALLLAVCVVTVVEIVVAAVGQASWLVPHPDIAADLGERSWQDGLTRLVLVAVVIAGLLLLYLGLKRSAPTDVRVEAGADGVTMTVSRRSLERYLAGVAAAQPGVARSSASVGRGKLTVDTDTHLNDPKDLQQQVQRAVSDRLDALRLTRPLRTTVAVHRKEN